MRVLTSKSLVLLVLALMLSITAAAQAPRVVPDNDNFADAQTLKPGKAYTVADPGAATEEAGEELICGLATANNSVWFTFTPELDGSLYLSTAGTSLNYPYAGSVDTMLGVYEGPDADNLNFVACNDDTGGYFSEVVFDFEAGDTYWIQLATYDEIDFDPSSYYRLTSRVLYLNMGPENGGFEEAIDVGWTQNNDTDDAIVCSDVDYPASEGVCAFKFTGGVDEKSKLTQTVTVPSQVKLRQGAALMFFADVRGLDSTEIGKVKFVITAVYKDGTPSNKVSVNLEGLSVLPVYNFFNEYLYLNSAKLSEVQVKVVSKATEGTVLLDNFDLEYHSGSHVRTPAGVLPLPQAPQ